MTTLHDQRKRPPRSSTFDGVPRTLADEHALLLRQVAARAEDVSSAAEDGWPQRELQALVGYIRTEVLRQTADEERLLFRACAARADVALLSHDHARLRRGADALTAAAGGAPGWTTARLTSTIHNILTLLEQHLAAEEAVLATSRGPGPVPATAALTGRAHDWYPLTEGTVVDLDMLPPDRVIDTVTERLLRLEAGDRVELRASTDLRWVWRMMDRLDRGRFGFRYLSEGPERWAMRVTRRREP